MSFKKMSFSVQVKAPAKINLGLSILGKLSNGYHEVKTVYSQISLFDDLRIKQIKGNKIEICSNSRSVPKDKENLVFKAAYLLKKKTRIKKGIRVFIKKNIPVGSGLGGGSSDAAVVLRVLNEVWQLRLSLDQLTRLALKIGSDVAYNLVGETQMEVQGGRRAGEFFPLGRLPECYIVVCVPAFAIESKVAYSWVEYDKIGKNDLRGLVRAIRAGDLEMILERLYNDFEKWTLERFPVLKEIKSRLVRSGAGASLVSGKGSAVFGVFSEKELAKKAFRELKKDYKNTFLTKPFNKI